MKIASLAVAVLLGSALAAAPALAHDDAYLDTQKAPNGGQLRMAGPFHYELVIAKDAGEAKDSPVLVYVTDHGGQKIPTAGANGTATILSGGQKATVSLVPDGDNRMKGTANYKSSPAMKAVVSIALAGKAAEQARFTPLAKEMAQAHAGH